MKEDVERQLQQAAEPDMQRVVQFKKAMDNVFNEIFGDQRVYEDMYGDEPTTDR